MVRAPMVRAPMDEWWVPGEFVIFAAIFVGAWIRERVVRHGMVRTCRNGGRYRVGVCGLHD